MLENQNSKRYDLEERTFIFAQNVRILLKHIPKNISNIEDSKQAIRSSGSVGANYIEANESLSKKDFFHRIRICRKEAKETRFWLNLIETDSESEKSIRVSLIKEATELMLIFGSILKKSE